MVSIQSHVYSTKYNFSREMYPPEQYGRVSGLVGLVAGLLLLFNILINSLASPYVGAVIMFCLGLMENVFLFATIYLTLDLSYITIKPLKRFTKQKSRLTKLLEIEKNESH